MRVSIFEVRDDGSLHWQADDELAVALPEADDREPAERDLVLAGRHDCGGGAAPHIALVRPSAEEAVLICAIAERAAVALKILGVADGPAFHQIVAELQVYHQREPLDLRTFVTSSIDEVLHDVLGIVFRKHSRLVGRNPTFWPLFQA